ncbi:integral membrane family protein [Thalictrum thalictroides]|uniref:Integral membrane family protein n=1 Tax=Thalictrum thalictroides TaxID=46969 RepID=A0A7J6VGW4_THATH|nr:integral membrane family protein [Thalictrum thalictroides]
MAAITLLSSTFTTQLLFKTSLPIISNRSHSGSLSLSSSSRVSFLQSDSRVLSNRLRWIRCQAVGDNNSSLDSTVYQGIYGPWSVDQSDVREVILYRSGLVTAAASFVIGASTAFLPEENPLRELLKQNLNFLYALGAGGLGLSLFLIHIYVTEIKRTLQALWALGVVGSLATYLSLAQPVGQSLPDYVVENPTAVWLVGPLFAALTGLVFKEGLCYGKLEAGILTFVIPTVLLGHLTGLMDNGVKLSVLGVWMVLFVIFSARKFTQPIKDDIGDKSVFIFSALPENEKKALLEKLEDQNTNQL